jgi:hypothetical protein
LQKAELAQFTRSQIIHIRLNNKTRSVPGFHVQFQFQLLRFSSGAIRLCQILYINMSGLVETFLGGSCIGAAGPGAIPFHIPSGYGYVVLTAVGSMFMLVWKGIKVRRGQGSLNFTKY